MIEAAASARRMRPSTYMRVAVLAAAQSQPLLTEAELTALVGIREQLRLAGQNLNTLLRDYHFHRLGYETDEAPDAIRLRSVVTGLDAALSDLRAGLEPLARAGLRIERSHRRR